jgi:hypothetical protein
LNKVVYSHNLLSYFYIQRIEDQLLIISIGPDNPFEFAGVLVDAIHKNTEQFNKSEIEVYFDLLSCVGNTENRYSKLVYNRFSPTSFINNITRIDSHELPASVYKELKKFYSEHLHETLCHSILSNKEKSNLAAS